MPWQSFAVFDLVPLVAKCQSNLCHRKTTSSVTLGNALHCGPFWLGGWIVGLGEGGEGQDQGPGQRGGVPK